jgi:surface polysaccharide O-acyltransferase-like enzyme
LEFFIKHQKVLFRSIGGALIFISFVAFFWTTPKEGFSENEIAAANVARMEARIAGQSSSSTAPQKENKSPFLETYKETQEKHMRYMLIIMMIFGVVFLAYSFISKKSIDE